MVMKLKKKDQEKMEAAIAEDSLIQGLLAVQGKRVEIIAFGVSYVGNLESVDADNGVIVIVQGDDRAMIEMERISSMTVLTL